MKTTRREMLATAAVALGGAGLGTVTAASESAADAVPPEAPFRFCLNAATIRGYNLPITEQVDLAARVGYDGIEPWLRDIHQYVEGGGSVADLAKRIADQGLAVESAIAFSPWIVDDNEQRARALDDMRRDMQLLAALGGRHIAAPPTGAHRTAITDLDCIAERYRAVLELGDETGVSGQLEIWGSSQTLSRLRDAVYVVVAAEHPRAGLLLDAYHLYKGGNDFVSLRQLSGAAMHAFHINDYPADPPRETIGDGDRVFPGDGVCPLPSVLESLYDTGFRGALSLELFNRSYWESRSAEETARIGLEKCRNVVDQMLAPSR